MSTCAAAPQLYGKYVHVGAKSGVFLTALHLQNNQLQAITTQVYVEDLTRHCMVNNPNQYCVLVIMCIAKSIIKIHRQSSNLFSCSI
jgi:hypothetical protein